MNIFKCQLFGGVIQVPVKLLLLILVLAITTTSVFAYTAEALKCYQTVTKPTSEFIQVCRAAVEQNDAHAMYLLALRSNDDSRQLKLLQDAASQNHFRAIAELSDRARSAGDIDTANKLEEKAAGLGHGPSRINYAIRLRQNSSGNTEQLARARQLFLSEAQNGFPKAQLQLALMIANGEGGNGSVKRAIPWLTEAAIAGHPQAQFQLALLHRQSNPDQAISWLVKAARSGITEAKYQLAKTFASGSTVNIAQAAYWAHRAVRDGHREAPKLLEQILKGDDFNAGKVKDDQRLQNTEIDIEFVQLTLNRLGYDAGLPDGQIGSRTRKSIEKFESDVGMPITGSISDELVRLLRNKVSVISNIEFAQSTLNRLGYDAGTADSKLGSRTRKAIEEFESDAGMPVTGSISKELIRRLSRAVSN